MIKKLINLFPEMYQGKDYMAIMPRVLRELATILWFKYPEEVNNFMKNEENISLYLVDREDKSIVLRVKNKRNKKKEFEKEFLVEGLKVRIDENPDDPRDFKIFFNKPNFEAPLKLKLIN